MLDLSQSLSPKEQRKSKPELRRGDAEMFALVTALQESSSIWIDAAIQRSGLSQAILHSLATFTEISQITDRFFSIFALIFISYCNISIKNSKFFEFEWWLGVKNTELSKVNVINKIMRFWDRLDPFR